MTKTVREILTKFWMKSRNKRLSGANLTDQALAELREIIKKKKEYCRRKHTPLQMSYVCEECNRHDDRNSTIDEIASMFK